MDKGLDINLNIPFIEGAFNLYTERIYNLLFLINCL